MQLLTKSLISVFLLVFALNVQAQEKATAVLSNEDISLFLKTFKPLAKDLEKLGEKYQNTTDVSTTEALFANKEAMAIFKKHGWNELYAGKFSTIMSGTTYLSLIEELDKLPAEQRAFLAPQIEMYRSQVGNVHPNDLEKIKKNLPEIRKLLEEYNN